MFEIEIKARLKSFDDVRENMAKLGVWLEDKRIEKQEKETERGKIEIIDLKERYGYKDFKLFLHDVQKIGKFIEISIQVPDQANEKDKDYAKKKCLDLLNFLVPDAKPY